MATHMVIEYCDIRIRMYYRSTVHDVHVSYIPVNDWHTGEAIFNRFSKLMDDLSSDWRGKIIGASSDGKKNITGQYQGVFTWIELVAKLGFMRVSCSAHQLDFCVQLFYVDFQDECYS